MESASIVPATQTTQEIPTKPAAQSAPAAAPVAAAAAAPSQDLLSLDVNPFQAKVNNVLDVSQGTQQWNQTQAMNPSRECVTVSVLTDSG